MPLLMCPNDNSAMQTLDRNGVQFDMCPTCRGVWLDRGELEKLMEGAAQEGRASAVAASPEPTTRPTPRPHDDRYVDDRHGHDRYRGHDDRYRKKKRLDIFDIFD